MSTTTAPATVTSLRWVPRGVPWLTVTLVTGLMAYADGFVLTSLQTAIGSVGPEHGLFLGWLRSGTLLVPPFVLAVLWALRHARRRYGDDLTSPRAVAVTSLLIVLAGTVVGAAAVLAASASSYGVQSQQLQQMQAMHHMAASASGTCSGTCEALRSTLWIHVRGVAYASGVLLLVNLVLVAWAVSIRGGRLQRADA